MFEQLDIVIVIVGGPAQPILFLEHMRQQCGVERIVQEICGDRQHLELSVHSIMAQIIGACLTGAMTLILSTVFTCLVKGDTDTVRPLILGNEVRRKVCHPAVRVAEADVKQLGLHSG